MNEKVCIIMALPSSFTLNNRRLHGSVHSVFICGLDIGYCDKYHLDFDEDESSSISSDLHDEILQAPWNTTRAYLGALKGKCLLQIFGIGGKPTLSLLSLIDRGIS